MIRVTNGEYRSTCKANHLLTNSRDERKGAYRLYSNLTRSHHNFYEALLKVMRKPRIWLLYGSALQSRQILKFDSFYVGIS